MRRLVFLAVATALACSAKGGPAARQVASATIGPQGGSLTSLDGAFTITFEPGSLPHEVEITIRRIGSPATGSRLQGTPNPTWEYEVGTDPATPWSATVQMVRPSTWGEAMPLDLEAIAVGQGDPPSPIDSPTTTEVVRPDSSTLWSEVAYPGSAGPLLFGVYDTDSDLGGPIHTASALVWSIDTRYGAQPTVMPVRQEDDPIVTRYLDPLSAPLAPGGEPGPAASGANGWDLEVEFTWPPNTTNAVVVAKVTYEGRSAFAEAHLLVDVVIEVPVERSASVPPNDGPQTAIVKKDGTLLVSNIGTDPATGKPWADPPGHNPALAYLPTGWNGLAPQIFATAHGDVLKGFDVPTTLSPGGGVADAVFTGHDAAWTLWARGNIVDTLLSGGTIETSEGSGRVLDATFDGTYTIVKAAPGVGQAFRPSGWVLGLGLPIARVEKVSAGLEVGDNVRFTRSDTGAVADYQVHSIDETGKVSLLPPVTEQLEGHAVLTGRSGPLDFRCRWTDVSLRTDGATLTGNVVAHGEHTFPGTGRDAENNLTDASGEAIPVTLEITLLEEGLWAEFAFSGTLGLFRMALNIASRNGVPMDVESMFRNRPGDPSPVHAVGCRGHDWETGLCVSSGFLQVDAIRNEYAYLQQCKLVGAAEDTFYATLPNTEHSARDSAVYLMGDNGWNNFHGVKPITFQFDGFRVNVDLEAMANGLGYPAGLEWGDGSWPFGTVPGDRGQFLVFEEWGDLRISPSFGLGGGGPDRVFAEPGGDAGMVPVDDDLACLKIRLPPGWENAPVYVEGGPIDLGRLNADADGNAVYGAAEFECKVPAGTWKIGSGVFLGFASTTVTVGPGEVREVQLIAGQALVEDDEAWDMQNGSAYGPPHGTRMIRAGLNWFFGGSSLNGRRLQGTDPDIVEGVWTNPHLAFEGYPLGAGTMSAFPVAADPGASNNGAPDTAFLTPDEIAARYRALGARIIQLPDPRSYLGAFNVPQPGAPTGYAWPLDEAAIAHLAARDFDTIVMPVRDPEVTVEDLVAMYEGGLVKTVVGASQAVRLLEIGRVFTLTPPTETLDDLVDVLRSGFAADGSPEPGRPANAMNAAVAAGFVVSLELDADQDGLFEGEMGDLVSDTDGRFDVRITVRAPKGAAGAVNTLRLYLGTDAQDYSFEMPFVQAFVGEAPDIVRVDKTYSFDLSAEESRDIALLVFAAGKTSLNAPTFTWGLTNPIFLDRTGDGRFRPQD